MPARPFCPLTFPTNTRGAVAAPAGPDVRGCVFVFLTQLSAED